MTRTPARGAAAAGLLFANPPAGLTDGAGPPHGRTAARGNGSSLSLGRPRGAPPRARRPRPPAPPPTTRRCFARGRQRLHVRGGAGGEARVPKGGGRTPPPPPVPAASSTAARSAGTLSTAATGSSARHRPLLRGRGGGRVEGEGGIGRGGGGGGAAHPPARSGRGGLPPRAAPTAHTAATVDANGRPPCKRPPARSTVAVPSRPPRATPEHLTRLSSPFLSLRPTPLRWAWRARGRGDGGHVVTTRVPLRGPSLLSSSNRAPPPWRRPQPPVRPQRAGARAGGRRAGGGRAHPGAGAYVAAVVGRSWPPGGRGRGRGGQRRVAGPAQRIIPLPLGLAWLPPPSPCTPASALPGKPYHAGGARQVGPPPPPLSATPPRWRRGCAPPPLRHKRVATTTDDGVHDMTGRYPSADRYGGAGGARVRPGFGVRVGGGGRGDALKRPHMPPVTT